MTQDDSAQSAQQYKEEGNTLFAQQKFLAAAAAYSKAIKLDPENSVLYSNRSAALLKLQKVSKALEDAEKCIALRPDWDKGYFRKGSVLEDQGKLSEALDAFQAAYKLNPESKELATKIRTLTKLVDRQSHKQQTPVAADDRPAHTAAVAAPASDVQSQDVVYEDLGTEAVANFTEEHLGLLAGEIQEHGTDFIPMVHMLPGPHARITEEVQPHVRGAGAWDSPQMLSGFMDYLRSSAEALDAEAVLVLVPRSAIGWPQTWTKPKWPCGDQQGVFALLESRKVYKLWFVPVTKQDGRWKPGITVSLDPEVFSPVPGRLLRS